VFTLNLLVDLDNVDGAFSPNRAGTLLVKSNIWLKRNPDLPDPPPDPEDPNSWDNIGEAGSGTLLIPSALGQVIGVRIARDPSGAAIPTDARLDLVLAFGAPVRASQKHSSPFTHDGTPGGRIVTNFQFDNLPLTSVPNRAWFVEVGAIARIPQRPNKVHRFEFALGAIIKTSTRQVHFGIDPEMDVGM
jgi:hypothetical protein